MSWLGRLLGREQQRRATEAEDDLRILMPGMRLSGVTYFNLEDAAWRRSQGVHRLDFGLDLTFDSNVVGLCWDLDQSLQVRPWSVRLDFIDPEAVSVVGEEPWASVEGRRLEAVHQRDVGSARWAVALVFEEAAPIWIAAAYLIGEQELLVPLNDEILIVTDHRLATEWGLDIRG